MLRNQFPEEEEHGPSIEKARRCLLTFSFSGQACLVALCRWSHSDMVSFHLHNLFAASYAVIESMGNFTCDSSLEI